MTRSAAPTQAADLRVEPAGEVLDRVGTSLRTHLDRGTVVRKRRSVGARTACGTWVRIERRAFDRIGTQGWNGTECAAFLDGVAQPEWYGCMVWRDADEPVMWRADEIDLLPAPPIGTAVLSEDPGLPDEWWPQLNASLDALMGQDPGGSPRRTPSPSRRPS